MADILPTYAYKSRFSFHSSYLKPETWGLCTDIVAAARELPDRTLRTGSAELVLRMALHRIDRRTQGKALSPVTCGARPLVQARPACLEGRRPTVSQFFSPLTT